MEETLFTLVVTRQGYGFLFGTMEYPFAPEGVKSICKTMGIKFTPVTDEFDDMVINDINIGGIYFSSTDEIQWYDLNDGTVEKASKIE